MISNNKISHHLNLNIHNVPATIICDDNELINDLTLELSQFVVPIASKTGKTITIHIYSELSAMLNFKLRIQQIKKSNRWGRVISTDEIESYTDIYEFQTYFFTKKNWNKQEALVLVLNHLGFLMRLLLTKKYVLTVFHGASLVYQDNGLLLLGESGAGKTSLSYLCIRNGFQYLTDENSFVIHNPDQNLFMLLGIQRRLRLCDEILNILGVKKDVQTKFEGFGERGIIYDPREDFPDAYGTIVPLSGIIILNNHHRNQNVSVELVPYSFAFTQLLQFFENAVAGNSKSESLISQYNRNGFNIVSAIAERFKVYQINFNFFKHFSMIPFFIKQALSLEKCN